jgi:FlaA1/EpsC-like NDP-sugar epimerase
MCRRYARRRSTDLRLVGGLAGVFAAALTVVFFLKLEGTFSRVWLVIWFVSALAALLMARVAFFALVRHLTLSGRLERRTVIVGGGEAGEAVLKALSSQRDTDLRILGVFDDRDDDRSPDVVGGFPKLGRVDDLVEFARHTRLDLVIFTLPISAEAAASADAAQAVGAADRHSSLGAQQQAAVPAALLFLHRHRSGARRLRQADRRLGRGAEKRLRPRRRRPGADRRFRPCCC